MSQDRVRQQEPVCNTKDIDGADSSTTPKILPPPLMPYEERRKLLNAPITFHIIGAQSWGGAITYRSSLLRPGLRARSSYFWDDYEQDEDT